MSTINHLNRIAIALVAGASLLKSAHAGGDGYTGRVVKWKEVGWYHIEALPDMRSCSATANFDGGTMLMVMAMPDQFILMLADNKWSSTFHKGEHYAPTIELDNKWENRAAESTMDGSIVIANMGKPMVAAFMEADALGLSMNGNARMAVLDLKYTRSMMYELANCAVTISTGNADTSSNF